MRKVIRVFCILFLLAILWSCADKSRAQNEPEIVVGIEASPSSLDPRLARDAYAVQIMPLVFPGLFRAGKNLEPEPDLVKNFKQIDDRTFIFELRPQVRFADGRELSAEDVKATIESLSAAGINSPYLELFERISKLEILGPTRLKMELKEPYAPILVELNLGILPAETARKKTSLAAEELLGTGPYRIESWVPGTEIILERNESYSGPKPYFKRIKFRIIPEDITRLLSLEKGEIHIIQSPIPADELARLKLNPRLNVSERPGINYSYLGFNMQDPVLKNLKVREAIAHAINREQIINCLLKKTAVKADSLLSPQHWAFEPEVSRYEHNPDAAQSLLDQAGFPDPDGDGPLTRFKLSYKTSQNQSRIWIAEAIAAQLRKVGIDVEVRSLEWGTLYSDIQAGNFQIFTMTWVGVVEPDIYYTIFDSESLPPRGANRGRYSNAEIDRLVRAARITQDRAQRKMIYSKVQKILARDIPYLSLWYSEDIAVSDKRLLGFELGPGGEWTSLATARFQE